MSHPVLAPFPGALYDGDGALMAGNGPEITPKLTEDLPHKALIRSTPGEEDGQVAVLQAGDRLWLLPDSFGRAARAAHGPARDAGQRRQAGRQGRIGRT